MSVVAVNARWHWSNHAAAVTGGIVLLTAEVGIVGLLMAVPACLVCWSRVALGRHDNRELAGGILLGVAVPLLALLLIGR
jgi:hypothetical protein